MARINTTNLFDVSTLPSSIATELTPLINYVNQLSDDLVRSLRNGITLTDNFKGQTIGPIKLEHNVWSPVNLTVKGAVSGMIVLQVVGDSCSGFGWRYNAKGSVEVLISYPGSGTNKVTLFAYTI